MRINQSEIIDDIEAHIRKFGGDFSEWCVGTARDSAFFRQHLADPGEGLIYREAYTSYAADGVIERLVSGYGLRPDRASARGKLRVRLPAHRNQAARTSGRAHRDGDANCELITEGKSKTGTTFSDTVPAHGAITPVKPVKRGVPCFSCAPVFLGTSADFLSLLGDRACLRHFVS